MRKTIALDGQKFGMLTVVSEAGINKYGNSHWLCRCDCGNEKVVQGGSLRSGDTKSCGCLRRALLSERKTIHGNYRMPEYIAWKNARHRCTDPNYENFHAYAGRGIEFRLPDFVEFLAHVGPRPSNKHSLDRIDNKGHYEIGNLRWALENIQNRNKRNNRYLTYQNETLCLADWTERLGCSKSTIAGRLERGWSVEATLETPIGAKR